MGNIATPNIIRASDIMDLTNNSITTGNIYASGTSATIGTSDNPFNAVYANTYYGTKFKTTKLVSFSGNKDTSYNFSSGYSLGLFSFLIIRCHFTTSYQDYIYQLIPLEGFETGTTVSFQSYGSISENVGYLVLTIQNASVYVNNISWVSNCTIWGLK